MSIGDVPLEPNQLLEFRVITYDPSTIQLGLMVAKIRIESVVGGLMTDQDLAIALDDEWSAMIKPMLATDVRYYGVGVKVLQLLPPATEKFSIVHDGPGTVVGATAPGQLTGLITMYTPFSGRAGHGRKYTPFLPFLHVESNNQLSEAYVGLMEVVGTYLNLASEYVAGGQRATIRYGLTGPTLSHFYPFVSHIAQGYIATQRRRGAYGKQNALPF